jgi:hypothetical protein
MDITLKNIKHMPSLSEETHCYSADVWCNGKKMFGMKNAGHGGCDEVYAIKGGVANVDAKYQEIDKELGKTIKKYPEHGFEIAHSLESEVCDIINKWLDDKEIKKVLRTVSYLVGDELYTCKVKPTPENIAKVKQQKWWKENNVVLNGKSMEELRPIFDKVYFRKPPVGGNSAQA